MNLDACPNCGGPADNGHDRCVPPNPYFCTKCNDPQPQEQTKDSSATSPDESPVAVGIEPVAVGSLLLQGQENGPDELVGVLFSAVVEGLKEGDLIYSTDTIAALQAEIAESKARIANQAAQITGKHQYAGQDFKFRMDKLKAELAEAKAYNEGCTDEMIAATRQNNQLQAENAELRKDAAELWKALNDLSFHCDAVFVTAAPPRSIYNSTFTVMDSFRAKYSPAAMKGEK